MTFEGAVRAYERSQLVVRFIPVALPAGDRHERGALVVPVPGVPAPQRGVRPRLGAARAVPRHQPGQRRRCARILVALYQATDCT